MRRIVLIAALTLASPAFAQAPSPVDPRLAGPLVTALKAQLDLAQAAVRVMQEDQEKKEADLAAWFTAWFGEKPTAEAK